jgi:hypothetical protein
MPVVAATDLESLMNLGADITAGSLSHTQVEQIIDQAIDMLNTFNANVPNMTGTVGSKSVSLTSKQKGAVWTVARAVYYGFYKNLDVATISGMAITTHDLLADANILKLVRDQAEALRSDIPPDLPIYDVRIG